MQTVPALPDVQFLDDKRRKLHRVMDTSLRDLEDRLRDHFRQGSSRSLTQRVCNARS